MNNEVRDIAAQLLSEVCTEVRIEPKLQPLSGEKIHLASANREDNARLDISANGFWGGQQERSMFDVRVFNPYAPSNKSSPVRVRFRHSFFACCAQNEFLFAHTSAINKSGLMAFFTRFVQAVHKTNLGLEFEIPFFVLRTRVHKTNLGIQCTISLFDLHTRVSKTNLEIIPLFVLPKQRRQQSECEGCGSRCG